MISTTITAAVIVLCLCAAVSASEPLATAQVTEVEGLSLAEISRAVETQDYWHALSSDTPFDLFGIWGEAIPDEARGKKPKPGKMAMAMAGSAAMSMLIMKAVTAIKLFIIHSFFATKLGLVIGAYLLLCKLAEMKQAPPPKKVIKWVSAPPSHSHYDEQVPTMTGHYPDSGQSSYEPQQQPAPVDEYGPPPAPQHHQQQQQQQFMPSGEYGGGFGGGFGGGDTQAHYSHVSPVTYRPMINRNQSENMAKSATGRA